MALTNRYRHLFRRLQAAGISGVLLAAMFTACSQGKPPAFADSLEGVDGKKAVALSEAYIDSIAQHNPEMLTAEIRSIVKTLARRGEKQAAIAVACLPYGIDPAQNPQIAERLLVSTLLIGQPAPALTANDGTMIHPGSDGQQTILFFYESRCRTCQAMIASLKGSYGELQISGVRIVTISSDTDPELFAEHSRQFPWKDKLCDLLGFHSPAFVSYGVAGTPTIFLIDETGMVTGQYGSVDELLDEIKKESLEHDLSIR